MAYNTLEEIAKDFEGRIAGAADDEKAELRAEYAEARAEFAMAQVAVANRARSISDAVAQYPVLKGFEALIVGNTDAEIAESAKKASEQLAALAPPQQQQAAPQQNLNPNLASAPVGGGTVPQVKQDENEQVKAEVAGYIKKGNPVPPHLERQFTQIRFREAMNQGKQNPSYRG